MFCIGHVWQSSQHFEYVGIGKAGQWLLVWPSCPSLSHSPRVEVVIGLQPVAWLCSHASKSSLFFRTQQPLKFHEKTQKLAEQTRKITDWSPMWSWVLILTYSIQILKDVRASWFSRSQLFPIDHVYSSSRCDVSWLEAPAKNSSSIRTALYTCTSDIESLLLAKVIPVWSKNRPINTYST